MNKRELEHIITKTHTHTQTLNFIIFSMSFYILKLLNDSFNINAVIAKLRRADLSAPVRTHRYNIFFGIIFRKMKLEIILIECVKRVTNLNNLRSYFFFE